MPASRTDPSSATRRSLRVIASLKQVIDALGARGEEFNRIARLDILREDEDAVSRQCARIVFAVWSVDMRMSSRPREKDVAPPQKTTETRSTTLGRLRRTRPASRSRSRGLTPSYHGTRGASQA